MGNIYPDITIEANDMGRTEVVAKVREEQKAGAFTGDIWNGSRTRYGGEFMPKQLSLEIHTS